MVAGEKDEIQHVVMMIRCEICGLTFANKDEKQKHRELEHVRKKKPAGVR